MNFNEAGFEGYLNAPLVQGPRGFLYALPSREGLTVVFGQFDGAEQDVWGAVLIKCRKIIENRNLNFCEIAKL